MKFVISISAAALLAASATSTSAIGAEVDPSVYAPMTEQFYPKTFAAWGAAGAERIDKLRRSAAVKVAGDPSCDTVYGSELSDNRSAAPHTIVVFVDCENGARFYLGEEDVAENAAITSQDEKQAGITDVSATTACEDAVLRWSTSPSSVTIDRSTIDVYRAPTTGNVAVTFDFESTGGVGGTLPYGARCVLDDRGIHPVEISERF